MRIFITSTNTDVGKTYVTRHLCHTLRTRGHRVCIFKPFQTEERRDGTSPDLEIFKNECDLSYDITSLCTFKQSVSPRLAFKMANQIFLNKQCILDKAKVLDKEFDFILIEGAGEIAVPIYEGTDDFYMTKDLINDCTDYVVNILPSKLGAINGAIIHQDYVDQNISTSNFLIMSHYTGSYIEKNNQITTGELTDKAIYAFKERATYEDFSEVLLKQLVGVKNELHIAT